MINIGVIGYGYWGPNLVRNFAETPGANIAAVADLDAAAVATPVHTHFEFGLAALRAGKHVWMEKPMTETSTQAQQLVEEADRRGLTLLVDHTFVYTGAVCKMGEIIKGGELGRIYYY